MPIRVHPSVVQCGIMEWVHQFRSWFARHRQKIGLIVVGHSAKKVEEYLFDWLIYGLVVYYATAAWGTWYGSLATFIIMAPISALFCWLYILAYDWAKVDWFGFEALKELREAEEEGWFGRIFRKVARLGDVPVFILLSIHSDPFMVTVYFRKREHAHKGLTSRDWKIFWGAVLFSNAYWTLRWTVIIELIRFLWAAIS